MASKQDDISAHQNKIVLFHEIKFSEQIIKMFKDLASVTVLAEIRGTMNGSDFHEFYRYGRLVQAKRNMAIKLRMCFPCEPLASVSDSYKFKIYCVQNKKG